MTPEEKLRVDPAQLVLNDRRGCCPEIVTAAALALERMDVDLAARPEGADLWVWPISESERRLVHRLQKQYPADNEMCRRVSRVLDEYLESTTVRRPRLYGRTCACCGSESSKAGGWAMSIIERSY